MIINKSNLDMLYTGFKSSFQDTFNGLRTNAQWNRIATEIKSNSDREAYVSIGQFPVLREWLGDRHISNLKQYDYTIKNKKYESTIAIPKTDIDDDNYSVYRPLFSEMAYAASSNDDYLIFNLLKAGFTNTCYDGQAFFSASHPVGSSTQSNTGGGSSTQWYLLCTNRSLKPLILQRREDYQLQYMNSPTDENVFMRDEFRYGIRARLNVGYGLWQLAFGSKVTLDATGYAAGRTAMQGITSDDGRPLGIVPDLLVVPPALESAARTLLLAPTAASGASNVWYNSAQLLVVPWLA